MDSVVDEYALLAADKDDPDVKEEVRENATTTARLLPVSKTADESIIAPTKDLM